MRNVQRLLHFLQESCRIVESNNYKNRHFLPFFLYLCRSNVHLTKDYSGHQLKLQHFNRGRMVQLCVDVMPIDM